MHTYSEIIQELFCDHELHGTIIDLVS